MGVRTTKIFQHRGKRYRAEFLARPFREGQEVRVQVGNKALTVAEFGLGEKAAISKLKAEIDRLMPQ